MPDIPMFPLARVEFSNHEPPDGTTVVTLKYRFRQGDTTEDEALDQMTTFLVEAVGRG